MHIDIFDEERFLATGALFSATFEDRTRYAYHGTSTLYSVEIEARGFAYPFFPIPADEIAQLAESLPTTEGERAATLHEAVRPTRLGFAPYSYASVGYATIGGGQVISLCRDAVGAGAIVPPGGVLEKRLAALDAAEGCVYAVDLSRLSAPDVVFERIFFQSTACIPADQIAAKILIPRTFQVTDRLLALQVKQPLRDASSEAGSLAARLKR